MASEAEIEAAAEALWRANGVGYRPIGSLLPLWTHEPEEAQDAYRIKARAVLEEAEAARPAVDRAAVEVAGDEVMALVRRYAADDGAIELSCSADETAMYEEGMGDAESAIRAFVLALIAPETGAPKP